MKAHDRVTFKVIFSGDARSEKRVRSGSAENSHNLQLGKAGNPGEEF